MHVREVASGLFALGHEVHVHARIENQVPESHGFTVHPSEMWFGHRFFRWSTRSRVRALIESLKIDLVVERYYNFAGEGIRAAFAAGIPSVLEVNSPVVDHPGSAKAVVDSLLIVRPMRRWREEQCAKASAIITPLSAIIPETVAREKIHPVSWGANVDRFRPDVPPVTQSQIAIPQDRRVVVFSGSFRHWHGADVPVRIASKLKSRGRGDRFFFLFLGDGPVFEKTKRLARELRVESSCLMTRGIDYEDMPSYLACADIGIAPYQPSRHAQMRLGFYWSPLKIFEYMAMGLPVVTLNIDPLRAIVRHSREGMLVSEQDIGAWADAVEALDAKTAGPMGHAARQRVCREFSWKKHCEQLDGIFRQLAR